MAGIDPGSPAAEQLLRDGGIEEDIIFGIRKLGFVPSASIPPHVSANDNFEDGDDSHEAEEGDFVDLDGIEMDLEALLAAVEQGEDVDVSSALTKGIAEAAAAHTSSDRARTQVKDQGDDWTNDLGPVDSRALRKLKYAKLQKLAGVTTVGTDSEYLLPKMGPEICICQRCFRLEQYGQVEESLRPGWSEHELITPERFEKLLTVIRESKGVVLCFVDVFDLEGSILTNLRQIAGQNPVVIAANKVDLLPKDASLSRLRSWIHADIKELCGFVAPKEAAQERRDAIEQHGFARNSDSTGVLPSSHVHMVSCQSGLGVDALMTQVVDLARAHGDRVFVMGAANVGKSSFINRLLSGEGSGSSSGSSRKDGSVQRRRGSKTGSGRAKRNKSIAQATVSNLPGTTLNFLKMQLPNGVTIVDTPGLINRGQLTSRLSPEELRAVIPAKPINPVTLRVQEGGCVLLGGLGVVEILEGKPFFLTFFVSNDVKLHPTRGDRADEFLQKHTGTLITPPFSEERRSALTPFKQDVFTVEGEGWQRASVDVVIAGLGWVSITGAGACRLRVRTPEGTKVDIRPAFMPYEARRTTAKFSGGRLVQKRNKKSRGRA